MLSAYVCRSGIALCTGRQSISKVATLFVPKPNAHSSIKFRQVSNQTGTSLSKKPTLTRPRSLKEKFMAPAGEGAFIIGKGVALGASGLGLGALAYYGLGFSSEPGAIDKSKMWSEDVKQRIRATYMYFCGSLAITATSVALFFQNSGIYMRIFERHPLFCLFGPMVVMIALMFPLMDLPYQEGFRAKQVVWALYCSGMGAVLAPLSLAVGGPLLLRAVIYTAGVVGGLTTIAVCAPSEKFLTMGGPLGVGLGVVFAASLANLVLPPVTALGAGLFSISLYGGLVLFSAYLLFDTQKIIFDAETHFDSPGSAVSYDPINASLGIYLESINIFIRIVMILLQASAKKKR